MADPQQGKQSFASIARFAVAHARVLIVCTAVAALCLGLAAATGLTPSSGTGSLTPKAAESRIATDRIKARFADDPIVVMVHGDLRTLLLTTDLGRLLKLEGCLGGNVPKGAKPYGGSASPCAAIARSGWVQRVYGPATFINEAANQVTAAIGQRIEAAGVEVSKARQRAREQALAAGLGQTAADAAGAKAAADAQKSAAAALQKLQVQTGLSTLPTIANPDFVSQVAFDPARGLGQPKARFSYLLPAADTALVQVRPKANLSSENRRALINQVRAAVRMPEFALKASTYTVTGSPVLAESLSDEVAQAAVPLLLISVAVMAMVLLLAFRTRLRLIPLVVAVVVAAAVFGAMALIGLPLTVAAVGGVPVLIGLAVDYAVQLQARVSEAAASGEPHPEEVAAATGGPAIAVAAVATMAGFLALLLSPVPMVKGFGLVMVVGVFVAVGVAFSFGLAALSTASAVGPSGNPVTAWLDRATAEAGQIVRSAGLWQKIAAASQAVTASLKANPGRVIAVASAVALLGWAVEGQLSVESDITRLVPQSTPALADVERLQASTGVAGEVDVLMAGNRALSPEALSWLGAYRAAALTRWGYQEASGCQGASLCPGVSITDLIGSQPSASQIQATLKQLPEYFKRAVVGDDGRSVLLSFGVRLLPLERQQQVFDDLRARARSAPAGISVSVGGLPVIAAEANQSLADPLGRLEITLAALAAVGLILLIALRSLKAVAVPLTATAIATGWATLGLWILGIDLNPLSAAFGAVVIAISTEFAVLLSERQRAESESGRGLNEAIDRAVGTTGRAIVISGVTVVTGFAVLAFSDIRVLRDFGIATVINLLLALAAVRVTVPALARRLDASDVD